MARDAEARSAVTVGNVQVFAPLALALLGAVVFLFGLGWDPQMAALQQASEAVLMMITGIIGFGTFFSMFLAAYYARANEHRIRDLENRLSELLQGGPAGRPYDRHAPAEERGSE